MTSNKKLLDEVNVNNEQRNAIILAIVFGGSVGFIVGIISASLLHQYIVHPLGF